MNTVNWSEQQANTGIHVRLYTPADQEFVMLSGPVRFAAILWMASLPVFAQSFTQQRVSVGASMSQIVHADFNGDGIVDLAIANNEGSISVLLGNGD